VAELHKFKDDTKSPEQRVAPIGAQHLDDNFKQVWLDMSDSLKTFLKITEAPGVRPILDFVDQPPSAESVPVFSGGVFLEWRETEECE
jgi:hypothetical protein